MWLCAFSALHAAACVCTTGIFVARVPCLGAAGAAVLTTVPKCASTIFLGMMSACTQPAVLGV